MPPGKALDGDDVLLLIYWKQRPPRNSAVVTPPLASEELCHSDLPRWIRRGVPHHSGFTSGVTSKLAHTRYQSVQGGIATGSNTQGCTGICHSVLWYVEECGNTWLHAVMYGVAQQGLREMSPRRYLERDIRHIIGFSLDEIDERTNEHLLNTPLGTHTPISLLYCLQSHRIWLLSLDALVVSNVTWDALLRQLDETQSIMDSRETFQLRRMVSTRDDGYMLRDGVI